MVAGIFAFMALVVVILFFAGYEKGLIRITLTLAMTLVSFFVSMFLTQPYEKCIRDNTGIYDTMEKQVGKYVDKNIPKEKNIADTELQNESINDLKLPKIIKDKLVKNNNDDYKLSIGSEELNEYVTKSITDILFNAFAVISLYVIVMVIMKIIVEVMDITSKLPVIHGVNKLLGGLVGVVEAALVIWLAFLLIMAMGSTHFGGMLLEAISNNSILSEIYNRNPLLYLTNIVG